MKELQKRTMRELPESERPYEKCLENGPKTLSNAELLAVIIRSGTTKDRAIDIANRLLLEYESPHTLYDVFSSGIEDLKSINGIGDVKAVTLLCVGEIARRISRESAQSKIRLSSPESIANYFMESMRHLPQEEVRAAFFDTKNNLIKDVHISTGTVNSSLVTPRELFIKALKYRAVYIVLLHNHPSGDPSPSHDDILLTHRLKEVGEIMSVPVLDHIIIGDNNYISFRNKGIL